LDFDLCFPSVIIGNNDLRKFDLGPNIAIVNKTTNVHQITIKPSPNSNSKGISNALPAENKSEKLIG